LESLRDASFLKIDTATAELANEKVEDKLATGKLAKKSFFDHSFAR